jgi:glycosyltransferase involved in cell wall biosynthesis
MAMIVNSLAPYRVHLHQLIAAGIPELKLHTLVTHGPAEFDWHMELPAAIHASFFGAGDSPLARILRRPIYEWGKGGRIINYLKSNDIRAVIVLGYRYMSYLRIIRYCDQAGVPLFLHNDSNIQNDRSMSSAKRWLKTRLYDWLMRQSTGIMSMGEYGDQFFIRYGADPRRLYRVPCTPDYESFATVDANQLQRFRQRFGLSCDRKYLLYSGRLVGFKRVDLLIDAFAAIAAARPGWDLLVAGDGPLADELRRRVPASLGSRVIWTGFLDREEPALAYHAADVLVLSSDGEPWALVIQEAMAAGLAVISSHVSGAARELIEDGRSGRIFPAGDRRELERAILQVTDLGALAQFKREARAALARWRRRVDPVAEVRRAMVDCGALRIAAPQAIASIP